MAKKTKTAKLARTLSKRAGSQRLKYLAVTTGVVFLAEHATRLAVTNGWRRVRGEDPPRNPERLDVSWKDAIAWTMATGIAMSAAGLLARRGAAMGWKRYVGRLPIASGRA